MSCRVHAHHPTNSLLGLLSVAHIYEAAASQSVDGVSGYELGVVDVTRDEVSDDCRHSVYQGRVINAVLGFGEKDRRTLGVEEDGILLEVWPLKNAPQFWHILLSIRGHCGPTVSIPRLRPPPANHIRCLSSPMNTIFLSVVLYLAKIGR